MRMRLISAWVVALVASAHATPGEFVLEAGQSNPSVASWGEACGPRPTVSRGTKGARYQFTADGVLVGSGAHTPLFAAGVCRKATGLPDLREVRAGKRISCTAKPDAPKQVKGSAELVEQDLNTLRVNQRFEYRWTFKETECAVNIRGSFRLRRDPPLADEPVAATPACASPGPVATVSGAGGGSVESGQKIRLRLRAQDAAGCPRAAPQASWSATAGKVENGIFDASGIPPGTVVTVQAEAGRHQVSFKLEVVEPIDLSPAPPPAVELPPAPVAQSARGGARAEMQAPPKPSGSRLLVGMFVGLGLAILGIGMWISWRTVQLRRGDVLRQALADEAEADAPEDIRPDSETAPFPATTRTGPDRQCPACERVFDAVNNFCPHDGAQLGSYRPPPGQRDVPAPARVCPSCEAQLPHNATFCPHDGQRLAAAPEPTPVKALICPDCGAHYPDGTVFCGVDGARLVLIN